MGADGDRSDDSDYIFEDDDDNYVNDYEYPEDADEDSDEDGDEDAGNGEDRENEDEEEEEQEERAASEIRSEEDSESDVSSLTSGQGEEEVEGGINVVDGLGSSSQAQACRRNIRTFRRSQENSLSIATAMIDRYVSGI